MNKITLLGTGCPSPSHIRYGPSILLEYDGLKFLFDSGSGVTQRLSQLDVKPSELDSVFITHMHSDHIVDLYQVYISGWHTGRERPFIVYGPRGISEHFEGIISAYNKELSNRVKWEKRPNEKGLEYKIIEIGDDLNVSKDNVQIKAIEVDHHPVQPAYGYKIILENEKRIIISGDTRYSDNLIYEAEGADVLVHEVFIELKFNAKRMSEQTVNNIKDYHTSPEDVGKVASKAGVKKLVLTHFVPPVFDEEQLKRRIAEYFSGEIIVGSDLMSLKL